MNFNKFHSELVKSCPISMNTTKEESIIVDKLVKPENNHLISFPEIKKQLLKWESARRMN